MDNLRAGLYEYFVEFLNDMINAGALYCQENEIIFDYETAKDKVEEYEYY